MAPRHNLASGERTIIKGVTSVAGATNLSLIGLRYWTDENGKRPRPLTIDDLKDIWNRKG